MASQRELDIGFMQQALAAARKGRTRPNPRVGAVVVKEGTVVSVGYHHQAGMPHAEIDALAGLDLAETRGATLYVTLEPCNHHGRTPPCSEAVIASEVARVVIGCADPAPHVAGSVGKLQAAGIQVEVGVCERDARREVADFCKLLTTGMPYVTLKAALTLDGRMSTDSGHSKWITGEAARALGHALRAASDAIVVGVGTVIADDPQLTVRLVEGLSPTRVVFDRHLRTPRSAKVLPRHGGPATIIACLDTASSQHAKALEEQGASILRLPELTPNRVLQALGRASHMRVMVEGGPTLLSAFLHAGQADELHAFIAPKLVGNGPSLFSSHISTMNDALHVSDVSTARVGQDVSISGALSSFGRAEWTPPLTIHSHKK